MATVVEDLVVRLGFQTPGAAQAGAAIKSVGDSFSAVGKNLTGISAKIQSFFSGIKSEFRAGWAEGLKKGTEDLKKNGTFWSRLKDEFKAGWGQGLKQGAEDIKKAGQNAKEAKNPIDILTNAYRTLLGLGVVYWLRSQAHELMDLGSILSNTASELHTSATVVQELGYAAKSVDLDVGDLTGALRVLTRQTEAARGGSKEAAEKFRELGLSAEMLAKMPVDEQLAATADALLKIEDPSKRAAIQMQLFGRSGGKLAALLEQGSTGLAQLREDFRALGGGLSQDAIDALGDSEQALKKLDVSVLSFKSHLVLLIGPTITKMIDGFRGAVQWLVAADKKMHLLQVGGIAGVIYALSKLGTALKWINSLLTLPTLYIVGIALAVAALAVIIQDLYNGFTGGRSAIFEWIAEWAGIEAVAGTLQTIKDLISGISAGLEEIDKHGSWLKALGAAAGTKNERKARAEALDINKEQVSALVDQAKQFPVGSVQRLKLMKQANALNSSNIEDQFGLDAPRAARSLAGARDFGFDTSHISQDILDPSGAAPVNASADVTVNVAGSNASPADISAAAKQGTQDGINAAARKLAGASKR